MTPRPVSQQSSELQRTYTVWVCPSCKRQLRFEHDVCCCPGGCRGLRAVQMEIVATPPDGPPTWQGLTGAGGTVSVEVTGDYIDIVARQPEDGPAYRIPLNDYYTKLLADALLAAAGWHQQKHDQEDIAS